MGFYAVEVELHYTTHTPHSNKTAHSAAQTIKDTLHTLNTAREK
jgi:hypothetical protein